MKSITLRLFAALLALVMCVGMLYGCDNKSDDSGKKDGTTEAIDTKDSETDNTDKTTAATEAAPEETEAAPEETEPNPEETEPIEDNTDDILANAEKDPISAIMDGATGFVGNIEDKDDIASGLIESIADGATTYKFGFNIPAAGSVDVNAVVDPSTGAFSGKAGVTLQGNTIDASVWGDSDNLALKVPMLLGDNAYGVKYSTLISDLESSVLMEQIDMSLEEMIAELEKSFEDEFGMSIEEFSALISAEKITSAYAELMADYEKLYESLDPVVTEADITIGGTDMPAVAIEYTFSKESADIAVEASRKFIENLMGDLIKASGEDLDDVLAEIEGEMALEEDLSYKVYLDKESGKMLAIEFGIDEASVLITMTSADDRLDIDIDITVTADGKSETVSLKIDEVTENGKDGFIAVLSPDAEIGQNITLSLVRNTADGAFTLDLSANDQSALTVTGTLLLTDSEFEFGIDALTTPENTVDLGFIFSIKNGGTVESVPAYKNILTMTEDELSKAFGPIFGNIAA